jgi:hypothetical protein
VVQVQVELTGATNINAQTINWTVTSGGGSVPATSQTSNTGIGTVNWTLGSSIGVQGLRAEYTEPGSSTVKVDIVAAGVTNPSCVPGRYLNGVLSTGESWTSTGGGYRVAERRQHSLERIGLHSGRHDGLPWPATEYRVRPGRPPVSSRDGSFTCLTFTAMDLAQPWGSLRFDGATGQPSTISNASLDHGSVGVIGLSAGHVLQIDHATITEMTGQGVRIIAPGSFVHTTTISNFPPGAFGAKLGSSSAPTAVLDFSARVINTAGIAIEAAGRHAHRLRGQRHWRGGDRDFRRRWTREHQWVQHRRQHLWHPQLYRKCVSRRDGKLVGRRCGSGVGYQHRNRGPIRLVGRAGFPRVLRETLAVALSWEPLAVKP